MTKGKNTNCLEGMKCPECGSLGPFAIAANVLAEVTDSGVEEYYDVEWDDDCFCHCQLCGRDATVGDFKDAGETENA